MTEPGTNSVVSTRWDEMVLTLLKDGSVEERRVSLEFLSLQAEMSEGAVRAAYPAVQELLFHSEPAVRYFAHMASSRLRELAPTLAKSEPNEDSQTVEEQGISTRDILLRKIRLGSCYVVFEALERLTESRDPTLADPLLEYLREEKDPHKLAFLVKRLPRIPDPRIPMAVAECLGHSDFRVVANALEGLSEVDAASLKERFAELAGSPDHRVRGAAVLALSRYARPAALIHLKKMLVHSSIAFQDTALYVLKNFPAPASASASGTGLEELLEVSLNSRYPSIRLQALEISREPTKLRISQAPAASRSSERRRERGLGVVLCLSALLMFGISTFPRSALFGLFALLSTGLALFFRRSEVEFSRVVASAALIGCLVWGEVQFLALLGLLAIWIPPASEGSSEKMVSNRVAAWCLAVLAIGLTWLFYSDTTQALNMVGTMIGKFQKIDPGLATAVDQVQTFRWVVFTGLSGFLFFVLKLERIFPPASDAFAKQKRLFLVIGAGFLVMLAMFLSHSFSLILTLKVNGIDSLSSIFKHLGN